MTPTCHIREARLGDVDTVLSLYQKLVDDGSVNIHPDVVSDLRSSPFGFLLVAENEGGVVGTALLSICQDVMYGTQPFAVVENVIVDSSYRKAGIGSSLMAEIEQICIQRDCSKILLSSSSNRVEAHKFFRKNGFSDQAKVGFVKYRSQLTCKPNQAVGSMRYRV